MSLAAGCEERMSGQRPRRIQLAREDARSIGARILADEQPAGGALLQDVAVDGRREQAVGDPRGQAAVEQLRLQRRERDAPQEAVADRAFAQQDGAAELGVVAVLSEPLGAEEIGDADLRQARADRAGARDPLRNDAADDDAEPVAAQVPGAKLVAMPGGGQHAESSPLQPERLLRGCLGEDADALHADGALVLEACGPCVAFARSEIARDLRCHFRSRAAPLLHRQVEVLPGPGRLVQRQLLDVEVVLRDADQPRGARQFRRQQGNGPLREQVGQTQSLSQLPLFRCHSSSSCAEKTRNSSFSGSVDCRPLKNTVGVAWTPAATPSLLCRSMTASNRPAYACRSMASPSSPSCRANDFSSESPSSSWCAKLRSPISQNLPCCRAYSAQADAMGACGCPGSGKYLKQRRTLPGSARTVSLSGFAVTAQCGHW